MSDVKVKQLAGDVGIPVDTLLSQLEKAGVKKKDGEDVVTEAEKSQLLAHLRESHGKKAGEGSGSARKITLKRKSVSELQQPTAAGRTTIRGAARGGKTVSVEVRRKRVISKVESDSDKAKRLQEAEAAKKALAEQNELKKQIAAEAEARRNAETAKRESAMKEQQEAEEQRLREEEQARKEQEEQELQAQAKAAEDAEPAAPAAGPSPPAPCECLSRESADQL
jgi:translation initiation factor IF-2